MEKVCSGCGVKRMVERFYRSRVSEDGYGSRCKACVRDAIDRCEDKYKTVRLSPGVIRKLKLRSEYMGMSMARVMREIIEDAVWFDDVVVV